MKNLFILTKIFDQKNHTKINVFQRQILGILLSYRINIDATEGFYSPLYGNYTINYELFTYFILCLKFFIMNVIVFHFVN